MICNAWAYDACEEDEQKIYMQIIFLADDSMHLFQTFKNKVTTWTLSPRQGIFPQGDDSQSSMHAYFPKGQGVKPALDFSISHSVAYSEALLSSSPCPEVMETEPGASLTLQQIHMHGLVPLQRAGLQKMEEVKYRCSPWIF